MTVRYLVLWPTAACDLACPYCYRRERRGGRMPTEVADASLDLLAEGVRTTGQPAHVQLAGGEPTLVPTQHTSTTRSLPCSHTVAYVSG